MKRRELHGVDDDEDGHGEHGRMWLDTEKQLQITVTLYSLTSHYVPVSLLTRAVGKRSTPVTVVLTNPGAVAHKVPAPFARVVNYGTVCEQLSGQDSIGRNPWVAA